jgi:hypothetical protein
LSLGWQIRSVLRQQAQHTLNQEYRKIKRLFHRPLPPAASRAPALPGEG